MLGEEKKVKRLRTFADDFIRAQSGGTSSPTKDPAESETALEDFPNKTKHHTVQSTSKAVSTLRDPNKADKSKSDYNQTISEKELLVEPKTAGIPLEKVAQHIQAIDTDKAPNQVRVDVSEVNLDDNDSLLTTDDDIFDVAAANRGAGEGTIITDRKRRRFKLLPAMAGMVGDWFNNTLDKFEREPAVKSSIASSQDRSEILEKAARQRIIAPRDDYQSLTKRRGALEAEKFESSFKIKDKQSGPAPTWTHTKEDDVENTTSQNFGAAVPGRNLERFTVPVEKFPVPATKKSEPIPESPTPTEPARPTPTPPLITKKKALKATPVVTPPSPPPQYLRQAPKTSIFSKLLGWFSFAMVASLAVGLGVWVSLWIANNQNQIVTTTEVVPALVNAEEQIPVEIGSDPETLLRNILAVKPRPTTIVAHVYPKNTDRPATTAEVLSVLEWRAPQSFLRAIEDLNFGYYRNQEPFVILNVTSFDIGLSGMLEWEENLSRDLAPLFGSTVTGTFDPRINSVAEIVEPYYYDEVVANYDVRILNDEKQEERIVYSLLDRNTILITTNSEALEALANAVK